MGAVGKAFGEGGIPSRHEEYPPAQEEASTGKVGGDCLGREGSYGAAPSSAASRASPKRSPWVEQTRPREWNRRASRRTTRPRPDDVGAPRSQSSPAPPLLVAGVDQPPGQCFQARGLHDPALHHGRLVGPEPAVEHAEGRHRAATPASTGVLSGISAQRSRIADSTWPRGAHFVLAARLVVRKRSVRLTAPKGRLVQRPECSRTR